MRYLLDCHALGICPRCTQLDSVNFGTCFASALLVSQLLIANCKNLGPALLFMRTKPHLSRMFEKI